MPRPEVVGLDGPDWLPGLLVEPAQVAVVSAGYDERRLGQERQRRGVALVLTNLGVNAPSDPDVLVPLQGSQLALAGDTLTISFSNGGSDCFTAASV